MAALWFYKAHGWIGETIAWATRGPWVHVAIQHAVADVSVVTEAHPSRGVYCLTVCRTRPPDDKVFLEVPDEWTTKWLAQQWGVEYSWLDAFALAAGSAIKTDLVKSRVICTELAVDYLRAARASGFTVPELLIPDSMPGARVSPTLLREALVLPQPL